MIGEIVAEAIGETVVETIDETIVATTDEATKETIDETTEQAINGTTEEIAAKVVKGTIVEATRGIAAEVVDDTTARTSQEGTIVTTLQGQAQVATGRIGARFVAKDETEGTRGAISVLDRKAEKVAKAKAEVAAATNISEVMSRAITVSARNNENQGRITPDIPKISMLCLWKSRKVTTMILRPGASSRRTARRKRPKEKTRSRLCNGASRGRA